MNRNRTVDRPSASSKPASGGRNADLSESDVSSKSNQKAAYGAQRERKGQ
jgi:hypothetical protein